ncbi:MAG: zf-HC2 domain-containing protein [Actinobacteria bacterium]|nr:zf-HC2 domain-containing protein [Actinomycetota bacterium]
MRALRYLRRRRRPHTDSAVLACEAVVELVQLYLDGATDDLTSEEVGHHLDMCRRCGLQADVYLQIKATLAANRPVPDDAVERLRRFGEQLAVHGLPGSP